MSATHTGPETTEPIIVLPNTVSDGQATLLAGCVLVTPCNSFAAWVDEIGRAAVDLHLRVVIDDGVSGVPDPATTILVTGSPARARAMTAAHRAILMTDLDGAAAAGARAVGGNLAAGAIFASAALAEATMLEASAQITEGDGNQDTITLWPGLSVSPPPPPSAGFGSEEEAAWAAALHLYGNGAPRLGTRVRWEAPVFSYHATRADLRPALWEIDVTGPARYLVFGPYLTLTPGRWRSILRFAVDEDAAALGYRTEWGTRTEHVSEAFTPGRPGVFEIELEYEFVETAQAELRIVQTQGSLGGAFEFLGMELERTA